MNSGKAFIGILAGMAAGAALGVLFAPQKGSAIRKNMADKGDELANALSNKIDEKFNELISTIKGKSQKSKPHKDATTPTETDESEILD